MSVSESVDRTAGSRAGRQAILEAVVRVVAKSGLRGLTFRSLASEASVSPALVAHHFGTREGVIAEALSWVAQQAIVSTHLEKFDEPSSDFESALVDSLICEPEIHAFQIELMLEARRNPDLQVHIREIYNSYLSTMQLGSPGKSSAGDRARHRAVFAGIDGLILQFFGGTLSMAEFRESLEILWAITKRN